MKSFFTRLKYDIKEIIMMILISILFLFTVFYLEIKTNLPTWAEVVISVAEFSILLYISLTLNSNFYNPLCTYEVEGKLIDYMLVFEDWDNTPVKNSYTQILVVEYEYKGRKYKKAMKVMNVKKRKKGSNLKLKICRFCPRIIHIEKE